MHGTVKPASVRLDYIDGMRGLAATLVICYHYFSRWTPPKNPVNLYPYGDALYYFPLFHHAEYALMTLFVISGFVIVLTLERCQSAYEFAARRFARIWPALTLCCCITFIALSIIPNSPWTPSLLYFIPSLTTVNPEFFNKLFGADVFDYMDGAYWTLWVEMKYYFWICLLYFVFGAASYRRAVLVSGIAVVGASTIASLADHKAASLILDHVFIAKFAPWFLTGIGLYYTYKDNCRWYQQPILWVGLAGLVLKELVVGDAGRALMSLGVPLVFRAVMVVPSLTRLLSTKVLTTIGNASFCMYLLHQRIGISLMHWLGSVVELPVVAGVAVAFAIMTVVILVSMVLYDNYEKPLNQKIAAALLKRRTEPKVAVS